MRVLRWIGNVFKFTIYTSFISWGFWMLVYGFSIHCWEIEAFALFMIFLAMIGLALDWNDKAQRYIDG